MSKVKTEEEFFSNIKLVYSYYEKKSLSSKLFWLEKEDVIQELMICAWKSYNSYDESKSNYSTYLYTCLNNYVKKKIKDISRLKNMEEGQEYYRKPLSLDYKLSNEEGEEFSIVDMLAYDDIEYKKEELLKEVFSTSKIILSDRNYNILYNKIINNISESDLAKYYNTNQTQVYRIIKESENLLKMCFNVYYIKDYFKGKTEEDVLSIANKELTELEFQIFHDCFYKQIPLINISKLRNKPFKKVCSLLNKSVSKINSYYCNK